MFRALLRAAPLQQLARHTARRWLARSVVARHSSHSSHSDHSSHSHSHSHSRSSPAPPPPDPQRLPWRFGFEGFHGDGLCSTGGAVAARRARHSQQRSARIWSVVTHNDVLPDAMPTENAPLDAQQQQQQQQQQEPPAPPADVEPSLLPSLVPVHMRSFYRRPLPEQCVQLRSAAGRARFERAQRAGAAEAFFALIEQFHTQSEPPFCGLATLTMCLNTLGVDPLRRWRGVWRWYSEELLDCCVPLSVIRQRGITLPQFACLARCNGATCTVHYADQSSLDAFRATLRANLSGDTRFVVMSFNRERLGQTGTGHFSPIGAYDEETDSALVLDVARFKYPPFWASVDDLWHSMLDHDSETQRSRGFALLETAISPSVGVVWRPRIDQEWQAWLSAMLQETGQLRQVLQTGGVDSLIRRLAEFRRCLQLDFERRPPADVDAEVHVVQERVIADLYASPVMARIRGALASPDDATAETIALLFLTLDLRRGVRDLLTSEAVEEIETLRASVRSSTALATELDALSAQIERVADSCCQDASCCVEAQFGDADGCGMDNCCRKTDAAAAPASADAPAPN